MHRKEKFSVESAVAVAIIAFERNNRKVQRDYIKTENINITPNRIIMSELLSDKSLAIGQYYVDQARDAVVYLQQTVMMQTLGQGHVNRFLNNIVALLTQPEVAVSDFGLLAWVPKVVSDYQSRDQVKETSSCYESGSQWIGQLGDKVNINFTAIEVRFVPRMNCYAVYGNTDSGNLVFYWAKSLDRVIRQGKLQGRVKKQDIDQFHGRAKVTTLNYVKASK